MQVISVVMSVLSVAIRVWVFRFGGVRSSSSHSVQIKLVMVRVHGLPVRLTLIIFMMAVGRLSTVVAHVRHGRLGQSRGVLGVRMATHRSWEIGQNTRNLLLVRLSGAHCESSPPQNKESPLVDPFFCGLCKANSRHRTAVCALFERTTVTSL